MTPARPRRDKSQTAVKAIRLRHPTHSRSVTVGIRRPGTCRSEAVRDVARVFEFTGRDGKTGLRSALAKPLSVPLRGPICSPDEVTVKTESEIKAQVTAVRERVKELSGFWIGEGAAMVYVLEWVLGKRETAPAGELGKAGGDSQTIAINLARLAEKAAEQSAAGAASAGAGKKPPPTKSATKKTPVKPRRSG